MFRDEELPPEEVDKILEGIARKVVDREMEMYAKFILGMIWPLAFIGGQLGRVFISPYLFIFGDKENNVSKNIFIFEKKENIFKLIDKIDKLTDEREELKKDDYKGKEDEKGKSTLWKRFKEFMRF